MKRIIMVMLIIVAFAGNAMCAHFVFGYLYDADGSTGNASTANSFASAALYRLGISGQVGVQNNGPDEQHPGKIFPALYEGITAAAYCFTDVGSSNWVDATAAGQEIISVFEVYEGNNGWESESYIGITKTVIQEEDLIKSETILQPSKLIPIPAPQIAERTDSDITLVWEGMDSDYITGYTLYRKQLTSGNYIKITETAQNRGGEITYIDDYGLAIGAKYRYSISVHVQWGGGSRVLEYYETAAKSGESGESSLYAPEPSVTSTPQPDYVSPQLAVNVERERLIIFNNPSRDKMMKMAYHSEGFGMAHIYLYNLTGENSYEKTVPVSAGVNIFEDVLEEISSGVYVVRVTLDVNGRKYTLPARKLVFIK